MRRVHGSLKSIRYTRSISVVSERVFPLISAGEFASLTGTWLRLMRLRLGAGLEFRHRQPSRFGTPGAAAVASMGLGPSAVGYLEPA
jgi:hypothetical protein